MVGAAVGSTVLGLTVGSIEVGLSVGWVVGNPGIVVTGSIVGWAVGTSSTSGWIEGLADCTSADEAVKATAIATMIMAATRLALPKSK